MSNLELYLAILVMALVNFFTRVTPFLFFRNKDLPKPLLFIEKFFPPTIMTILIFYTLKDIDFVNEPYGLKEILGIVFTLILHLSVKNYLISIFFGTIFYMGLVQYM